MHKTCCEAQTYDSYKYIIEKRLNPKLGDYHLDELNREIFQDFVLSKFGNGNINTNGKLVNNSIIGIVNVLKSSMALAKSLEKIKRNEIKKIKLPSPTEKPVTVFEKYEQEKIEKILSYIKQKLYTLEL